jgi:hypothetical protein
VVPGVAEALLLLPRLPAGLFDWAKAVAMGAAIKPAASKSEHDFEIISTSFRTSRGIILSGDEGTTRQSRFGFGFCSAASRRINRV